MKYQMHCGCGHTWVRKFPSECPKCLNTQIRFEIISVSPKQGPSVQEQGKRALRYPPKMLMYQR